MSLIKIQIQKAKCSVRSMSKHEKPSTPSTVIYARREMYKKMDGGHGNNEISWSTRSISPNIKFLMKKNQDRMTSRERIGGRSKLPNVMLYGADNPSLRPRWSRMFTNEGSYLATPLKSMDMGYGPSSPCCCEVRFHTAISLSLDAPSLWKNYKEWSNHLGEIGGGWVILVGSLRAFNMYKARYI